MNITHIALVAAVNFINIQARAFQQLNVQHHRVWWVPVASIQMGACEVFLWGGAAIAAVKGTWLDMVVYALTLGVSGAAGAICSMYLHRWLRNR